MDALFRNFTKTKKEICNGKKTSKENAGQLLLRLVGEAMTAKRCEW